MSNLELLLNNYLEYTHPKVLTHCYVMIIDFKNTTSRIESIGFNGRNSIRIIDSNYPNRVSHFHKEIIPELLESLPTNPVLLSSVLSSLEKYILTDTKRISHDWYQ